MPEKEEMTYENDEYDDGYIFGWNQCLEKILDEKDKEMTNESYRINKST